MNIILSTDNEHKLREIRELVDGKFRVLSKTEAGYGDIHPVEDGDTLEANAMIRAKSSSATTRVFLSMPLMGARAFIPHAMPAKTETTKKIEKNSCAKWKAKPIAAPILKRLSP